MSAEPVPVDQTLSALADPVRRRAVELLVGRPHRAGELAGALGVAPSVMSKHLRVLRQSGLVREVRDSRVTDADFDARVRIYALDTGPMVDLRAWLDAADQAWAEQLGALRDHLARDR